MKELIYVEGKRVLNWKIVAAFLIVVLLLSMWLTTMSWNDYEVVGEQNSISIHENLDHTKKYSQGKKIDEGYLQEIKNKDKTYGYLDKVNLEALVSANYDGKNIADLSQKEMKDFYSQRVLNIKNELNESSQMYYTEKEKQKIIKNAEKQSVITMGYAEGWKNINDHMGICVQIILIISGFLLMPLFGNDPSIKMQDLYRSTRYGKKRLDHARIVFAYAAGILLYVIGIVVFVAMNILRFGMAGSEQTIQSNVMTFFSVYHFTYMKQFMVNFGIGLLAVVFTISLTLLISILADSVIAGSVVLAFVWIFLVIFGQMNMFIVNHKFINFTPLKMVDFGHYYTGNEVYFMFGSNIECMQWVMIVTGIFSIILLILAFVFSDLKRKKAL